MIKKLTAAAETSTLVIIVSIIFGGLKIEHQKSFINHSGQSSSWEQWQRPLFRHYIHWPTAPLLIRFRIPVPAPADGRTRIIGVLVPPHRALGSTRRPDGKVSIKTRVKSGNGLPFNADIKI